jgi:hypothetical protein
VQAPPERPVREADLPSASSQPAPPAWEPPPPLPQSWPVEPSWGAPPPSMAPPSAPGPAEPAQGRVSGLAEAFSALLAAEQGEPLPSAQVASSLFEAFAPADDLVERVSRRVLERLSERAVRETVANIVSSVAERVVREEIDRIKTSLRK